MYFWVLSHIWYTVKTKKKWSQLEFLIWFDWTSSCFEHTWFYSSKSSVREARVSLLHHYCVYRKTFCTGGHCVLQVSLPLEKLKPEASEVQFFFRGLCHCWNFSTSLVKLLCRKSLETFCFCRFSLKHLRIKWVTNLFFSANLTLISEKWLWPQGTTHQFP